MSAGAPPAASAAPAAPTNNWSAPAATAAPAAPAKNWSAPAAPTNNWSAPAAPANNWSAPAAPASPTNNWSAPASTYTPPTPHAAHTPHTGATELTGGTSLSGPTGGTSHTGPTAHTGPTGYTGHTDAMTSDSMMTSDTMMSSAAASTEHNSWSSPLDNYSYDYPQTAQANPWEDKDFESKAADLFNSSYATAPTQPAAPTHGYHHTHTEEATEMMSSSAMMSSEAAPTPAPHDPYAAMGGYGGYMNGAASMMGGYGMPSMGGSAATTESKDSWYSPLEKYSPPNIRYIIPTMKGAIYAVCELAGIGGNAAAGTVKMNQYPGYAIASKIDLTGLTPDTKYKVVIN